jgi:hypothetical protein
MAERYLLIWTLDHTKIPVDLKERAAGWRPLMDMVKEDLDKGVTKEWGVFAGEGRGYCVVEMTAADLHSFIQRFIPFVEFQTHPLVSAAEVDQMIDKLSEG